MDDQKSVLAIEKKQESGRRLKITIHEMVGFNDAEIKRHNSAIVVGEKVLNSLELKNKILAYKFDTTKKTSQEIYDWMMTGKETLNPKVDYEMDVWVEIYSKNNNVVGYTYGSQKETHLNRTVTKNYTEAQILGNLVHEWLHKASFDHDSASDHDSVPYAVGYMVRDLAAAYVAGKLKLTDLYPEVIVTPVEVKIPVKNEPQAPVVVTVPVKVPLPVVEPKQVCHWGFKSAFPWFGKICYFEK